MHKLKSILPLLLLVSTSLHAQTPYDDFAPEVSRPILELGCLSDEPSIPSHDTTSFAMVIDMQHEQVLLIDAQGEVVAYAPMTDDIRKWLSVDPLADKYPEISPYAYCAWNPIKYTDPDGRRVFFASEVSNSFKSDFKQAVTYMNQNGISGMLYQLEASPNVYYILEGIGISSSEFNPTTNTIKWFSRVGLITDNLYEMSPVEILNHEVDHALRHDTNPIQQRIDGQTNDPNYDNQEEKRVIMGSEQETARKLGKLNTTEVTRNNHNGSLYETTSPTTTEDKWSCTPSNY